MNKRYIIEKNGINFLEVDSMVEMYKGLEMTRQHFNQTIKGKTEFTFKKNNFKIIDKLLNFSKK